MFASGNKVKLNPTILEDESTKSNHHFFIRVLNENSTGEVLRLDTEKSTGHIFKYWIQFPRFNALLKEDHFVLLSKE
jgi:hypothetical protein